MNALQQILAVMYDHELDDIQDRIVDPQKPSYGDDFRSVDLSDTADAIKAIQDEWTARRNIQNGKRG